MAGLASIVDWDALAETVVASVIAGVGIVVVFSIAIYGAARFAEARRAGASLATGVSAVVTFVALLACVAAVVAGIFLMATGRA